MTSANYMRADRIARLDEFIRQNRVVRGAWSRVDADGRELACWLAAISPEAAKYRNARACPAWLIPPWLAHLIPFLDDAGTEDAWPEHLRRFAAALKRIHVLSDDDWSRLDYRSREIIVREARRYATDTCALQAIDRVLSLLVAAGNGEILRIETWNDVARVAKAAKAASAAAAAAAAESGAKAAASAEGSAKAAAKAASAAAWAAESGAWAAAAAAAEAKAAAKAASAAAGEAEKAAWAWAAGEAEKAADRIIDAVLTAIEDACTGRELTEETGS